MLRGFKFTELGDELLIEIFKHITSLKERTKLERVNKQFGRVLPQVTQQVDCDRAALIAWQDYRQVLQKSLNVTHIDFRHLTNDAIPDNVESDDCLSLFVEKLFENNKHICSVEVDVEPDCEWSRHNTKIALELAKLQRPIEQVTVNIVYSSHSSYDYVTVAVDLRTMFERCATLRTLRFNVHQRDCLESLAHRRDIMLEMDNFWIVASQRLEHLECSQIAHYCATHYDHRNEVPVWHDKFCSRYVGYQIPWFGSVDIFNHNFPLLTHLNTGHHAITHVQATMLVQTCKKLTTLQVVTESFEQLDVLAALSKLVTLMWSYRVKESDSDRKSNAKTFNRFLYATRKKLRTLSLTIPHQNHHFFDEVSTLNRKLRLHVTFAGRLHEFKPEVAQLRNVKNLKSFNVNTTIPIEIFDQLLHNCSHLRHCEFLVNQSEVHLSSNVMHRYYHSITRYRERRKRHVTVTLHPVPEGCAVHL